MIESVQVYEGGGTPTRLIGKLLEDVESYIIDAGPVFNIEDRPWMQQRAREFADIVCEGTGITEHNSILQRLFLDVLTETQGQRDEDYFRTKMNEALLKVNP